MTVRDQRSREHPRPASQAEGRERTQSLSIELPHELRDDDLEDASEDEPSHPSLAIGTHDAHEAEERTKVESPGGARKTPAVEVAGSGPRKSVEAKRISKPQREPTDQAGDHVGSTLGSYKVHELLGKGGMGYVYRAEHVKLGREVAIKLLRSDYARRRDAVARFIQEARTVNRIRHRNIVDVPDIVELEDGTTFIVMEFLRGQSLGKWARSGVDLPRALAVLVQICDGLAAAHAVNIVHRDLKPDNVIVIPTSDGAELVKLLDFGVAKLLNRDDEDLGFQTAAGSVIGTPAYMSPEQAGGMVIDARSDIYSLGAIMYELFCGQPMFRGRSFGEYVRKHLTEHPVRPRATPGGAQLDERLEMIILKALEKDPAARFNQIHILRDALLTMLGGLETHPGYGSITGTGDGRSIPPPLPRPLPSQPAAVVNPSQFFSQYSQVAPAQPSVTPWWVWFVGGAVAVAIGIGGALWYANRSDAPAAGAPPQVRVEPVAVAIESSGSAGARSDAERSGVSINPAPPPPTPKIVELRFDSLPSGSVFADGHSAELCTTPCAVNVDPKDGGGMKRTYLVRSEGFTDGQVVVDLADPKHDFKVTLERIATEVPKPVVDSKRGRHPGTKKPVDKRDDVKKPVEDVTPTKKPRTPGTIDPSETLDPFKSKP